MLVVWHAAVVELHKIIDYHLQFENTLFVRDVELLKVDAAVSVYYVYNDLIKAEKLL